MSWLLNNSEWVNSDVFEGEIGRSAGRPIPEPLRFRLERFFGTGFGHVRLHTAAAASRLGAAAFARGSDIYFAPDRLALGTIPGRVLLVHELTHVLQQRSGRIAEPPGAGTALLHDPVLEAEADLAALLFDLIPAGRAPFDLRPNGPLRPVSRALQAAGNAVDEADDDEGVMTMARLRQMVSSKLFLSALGIIGIGIYINLPPSSPAAGPGIPWSKGAIEAAMAVTKGNTAEKAGNYTVQAVKYFVEQNQQSSKGHVMKVASTYAGAIIPLPFAGLITNIVGRTVLHMWNGIPNPNFAIQVFQELDPGWRNRYLYTIAQGLPQILGVLAMNVSDNVDSAIDLANKPGGPRW
jgi:hypothetical protein